MKGFNSIGDLSRFAQLRQSNAMLKSRLSVLTQEVTTGVRADVAAATGGNLGRLAQVQSRLTLLESYGRNASAAQTEMDALQAALESIGGIAASRGPEFLAAQTFGDDVSVSVSAAQARQDFRAVVRAINTDVGGRFLLSGTAVTTAPLSQPEAILDLATAQIAGLTDPVLIAGALDDWFDSQAPDGFAAAAFHGNTQATTSGVSPDTTVSQELNALDPALKGMLKSLAIAVIATDSTQGLTRDARAALLSGAGQRLIGGTGEFTGLRAQVGTRQEIVEAAATRNAAEVTALSIARSDILAIDPYETASALTQTEASLQNLYSLTARLSRLSLTDYL